jgi:TRAP transporter TAXI family solute receptor
VNVLTGPTSGAYYPLGVALASVIAETMPGVKASVQATRGSFDNLTQLEAGKAELAFALGDALSDAWKGNEEAGFRQPLKNLRGVAAIYPNYIQFVARADSGIRTLGDLKGKTVSVGVAKSGIELNARAVLHAAGIDYKDFAKVQYLPFGESVELMKSRQIDATLQSTGLGASSLRDLASSLPIVFVPIPPDVVRKIREGGYAPAVIPADTYKDQTADVATAAVQNFLVTHEDVSTDVVYDITRTFWSHLDRLGAAHAAGRAIDPQKATQGMPIPLHPGAQKYYKEVGILK